MRHSRIIGSISGLMFLCACTVNQEPTRDKFASAQPIEKYACQFFIEGIPYAEAVRYPSSDADMLLRMLESPNKRSCWPNILTMLGIVGDRSLAEPMIGFIESDPEYDLDIGEYRAKTAAIMSLGYLVHRTQSEKALNYLVAGMKPDSWGARNLRFLAPYQSTTEERNRDLARHAILGLALSGNSQAGERLISFRNEAATGSQLLQGFERENRILIKEALSANKVISEKGLIFYYSSY